jgi:uncharacterized ferritin-like protein (DUF455 family)
MELRQRAQTAFCLSDPTRKADAVQQLQLDSPHLVLDIQAILTPPDQPGRPEKPTLVHPQAVPRRSPFTPEGHAALVHSIAHIEFNAMNLALDAVWRFDGMPAQYYHDWLRVAQEEAKHFSMLNSHLHNLGYGYGDFVAHDGLWTICAATQHDVVARMALVPRTMEARGLDATPIVQAKLRKVATLQALATVEILEVILQEEVGHVAIGNHWYRWLCQRDNLDSAAFYAQAAARYGAPRHKPPFNLLARRQAGFTEAEVNALAQVPSHGA